MFLIKLIYKFLKNFLKNFGYELNVQNIKKQKYYKFLNIYKSYQEAHVSSKNKDNYVTKESQKKTQLVDLNDLEVYYRWNIFPLFCALVLKKEIFIINVGKKSNKNGSFHEGHVDAKLLKAIIASLHFS